MVNIYLFIELIRAARPVSPSTSKALALPTANSPMWW